MLWMVVEADEYELPLAVCDTQGEVAEYCGISTSAVKSAIYRDINGERTGRKFVRIEED